MIHVPDKNNTIVSFKSGDIRRGFKKVIPCINYIRNKGIIHVIGTCIKLKLVE